MRSLFSLPRIRLLLLAVCLFIVGVSRADDLSATAKLSRSATGVGEPVQLLIQVDGADSQGEPPEVSVDGLEISYLGPSVVVNREMINGTFRKQFTVTFMYQVEPTRVGEFTIPALKVGAGGKTAATRPVVLKAQEGGTGGSSAIAKLEVSIPKKTLYLGESIPMELRLTGDARQRWQPQALPNISGEGFTKQKMGNPKEEIGQRLGRDSTVYTFNTVITPSKAGKIMLGPFEIPYIAVIPRARSNRMGPFADMDIFNDAFFAQQQQFKARARAIELEVKPLPAAGRPANFSGAVGQFKFEAKGAPNQLKIGDPLTMKLRVEGQGNFDRIEAPMLADIDGWRAYPATAEFKGGEAADAMGTKIFTVAVVPETKKTTMPVFEFSYFDPDAGKYVTLKSEASPLQVTGAVPPPPPPAPVAQATAEKPEEPAKPAAPSDIMGIRYDPGSGAKSFAPIYTRKEFIYAQIVPLIALLAFLFARLHRTDLEARALVPLKREKTETLARLRGRDLSDQEFLETAARVVQLDTAIATGRPAGSVDAAFALSTRAVDDATAEAIERIFSVRAEVLYAGAGERGDRVSAEERKSLLAAVEKFERSHERA